MDIDSHGEGGSDTEMQEIDPPLNNDGVTSSHHNGISYRNLTMEDLTEKEFKTVDEAETFYNEYSAAFGFGTRRHGIHRDRKDNITSRSWVCSKQGTRGAKWLNKENRKRSPKKVTRENCPANFAVRFCKEKGAFVVTRLNNNHSHILATQDEVPFIRSHRHVTDADMAVVISMRKVAVKTSRAYDYLVDKAGGHKHVGFTAKDLYNKLDAVRRMEICNGDAQSAISYLTKWALTEEDLFSRYSLDEDGRLANLFWRDSESLKDYEWFGDVLIFDSTYKTNVYGKPLVVFVGGNNHRATILFACAILVDETIDSYTWALEKFLESMNGKSPISVLTDGDEAIRNAIEVVFPKARHRLCAWHIAKNVCQNILDPLMRKEFHRFIYYPFTVEEFEQRWKCMVDSYEGTKRDWLTMMYNKRTRWAQAYFVGAFFAGMISTQRCEGMHNHLKDGIGKMSRILDIIPRIDKILAKMRFNVSKVHYDTMFSKPLPISHMLNVEENVGETFTHGVYLLILGQLLDEKHFMTSQPIEYPEIKVYYVTQYNRAHRQWTVDYHYRSPDKLMECSCRLFESDGIPCSHIFSVMKFEHMNELPSSLVLKRWTITANGEDEIEQHKKSVPHEDLQLIRQGHLSTLFNEIGYYASHSTGGYNVVMDILNRMRANPEIYRVEDSQTSANLGPCDHVVKDPIIAKKKGKRVRPSRKGVIPRRPPTCGHCGEKGHTRRGCTKIPNVESSSQPVTDLNSSVIRPSPLQCDICKEVGHTTRSCTNVTHHNVPHVVSGFSVNINQNGSTIRQTAGVSYSNQDYSQSLNEYHHDIASTQGLWIGSPYARADNISFGTPARSLFVNTPHTYNSASGLYILPRYMAFNL